MPVIVHGMPGSSYVQSVRMALEERGVEYQLAQRDAADYKRPPYTTELHPFGRVPALEHDDFRLYETEAILRYVAEAFRGPPLVPEAVRPRARMNQILGIVQAYFPGCLCGSGSINFYRAFAPRVGIPVDEVAVQAAARRARTIVRELERMLAGPFLCGALSLADLMVAPVMFVFRTTPEGRSLLSDAPKLATWIERVEARPSARVLALP